MTLVNVMAEYEDEVVCDLAETYHIYDITALSPYRVAQFIIGLRNNSRTKQKISGMDYSTDQLLLGNIVDKLGLLVWFQTKDGQKGRNRPDSIIDEMLGNSKKEKVTAFDSPESFREAWKDITERA